MIRYIGAVHFLRMMTSSNGSIFSVTGHLCGEFTGHRKIPRTKSSDAELWWFFYLHRNKRLSKQWWGWWFETPSRPLWRHCNGTVRQLVCTAVYINACVLLTISFYVHLKSYNFPSITLAKLLVWVETSRDSAGKFSATSIKRKTRQMVYLFYGKYISEPAWYVDPVSLGRVKNHSSIPHFDWFFIGLLYNV